MEGLILKLTTDVSKANSGTKWMPIVLTEKHDDVIKDTAYYLSDSDGQEVSRPSFMAGVRSAPGLCYVNPGAAVAIATVAAVSTVLLLKLTSSSSRETR